MNNKYCVYISRSIDPEIYDQLFFKPSIAASKFNHLIMLGLSRKVKIKSLYVFDDFFLEEKNIYKGNIEYYCCPSYGRIKRVLYLYKKVKQIHKIHKSNVILVCDALCLIDSFICQYMAKFYNWDTIGIITDLPEYLGDYITDKKRQFKDKLTLKLYYFSFNLYKKYILLTKQMINKIKNATEDNSIIIEGFGNTEVFDKIKIEKKRQLLYAGSLQKEFGILKLIEAFKMIHNKFIDYKLVIYGQGNTELDIKKLSEKYDFIDFKGIAPLNTILQEEVNSILLVNPRPVYADVKENDYTKYSFPSKNMEYMSSGTPMLAYKLPGMPDEYLNYFYQVKGESVIDLAKSIEIVLNKSDEELLKKGQDAKKFIRENKEYFKQTEKIFNKFFI